MFNATNEDYKMPCWIISHLVKTNFVTTRKFNKSCKTNQSHYNDCLLTSRWSTMVHLHLHLHTNIISVVSRLHWNWLFLFIVWLNWIWNLVISQGKYRKYSSYNLIGICSWWASSNSKVAAVPGPNYNSNLYPILQLLVFYCDLNENSWISRVQYKHTSIQIQVFR